MYRDYKKLREFLSAIYTFNIFLKNNKRSAISGEEMLIIYNIVNAFAFNFVLIVYVIYFRIWFKIHQ